MLYDPKWEKPVDVMSIDTLIAWLRTMPSKKRYRFICLNGGCLYSQYLTAHGVPWETSEGGGRNKWWQWHDHDTIHIASDRPKTFGAALDRALAFQKAKSEAKS